MNKNDWNISEIDNLWVAKDHTGTVIASDKAYTALIAKLNKKKINQKLLSKRN